MSKSTKVEDVAVAGFDDTFFTAYVNPPQTPVRQPFRELRVTAMETLAHLLVRARAHLQHVIPSNVFEGRKVPRGHLKWNP